MSRLARDGDGVDRRVWTRRNTPRTAYGRRQKHPCTRKPNPLGFFDLCGLVSEWCQESLMGSEGLYEVSATCIPNKVEEDWCWDAPWAGGLRILLEEE